MRNIFQVIARVVAPALLLPDLWKNVFQGRSEAMVLFLMGNSKAWILLIFSHEKILRQFLLGYLNLWVCRFANETLVKGD